VSYYDTLGVPKDADEETIKRAYRRKSKEHHPDRSGGNPKAMVAVNKAYETLGDPEKRARYDEFGEQASGNSVDEQAKRAIMQIFVQVIDKAADTQNLVDLVCLNIKANMDQIPKGVEQGERRLAKLKKARKKIKRRKSKDNRGNWMAELLDHQIKAVESGIDMLNKQKVVGQRALELLADFEYEPDIPTAPRVFVFRWP
jgi:curved DNA-binding protein CbpA